MLRAAIALWAVGVNRGHAKADWRMLAGTDPAIDEPNGDQALIKKGNHSGLEALNCMESSGKDCDRPGR